MTCALAVGLSHRPTEMPTSRARRASAQLEQGIARELSRMSVQLWVTFPRTRSEAGRILTRETGSGSIESSRQTSNEGECRRRLVLASAVQHSEQDQRNPNSPQHLQTHEGQWI